jgi:hypothetical protein
VPLKGGRIVEYEMNDPTNCDWCDQTFDGDDANYIGQDRLCPGCYEYEKEIN